VLVLAHEDHDEHRSTAVTLLHELAPVLARDLCMSFVGHELVAMSDDPRYCPHTLNLDLSWTHLA